MGWLQCYMRHGLRRKRKRIIDPSISDDENKNEQVERQTN